MTTIGYGFAYAAWIRTDPIAIEEASRGLHYFVAFRWLQERAA